MLAGDCPGWHEILVPPGTFCPGSTTGIGVEFGAIAKGSQFMESLLYLVGYLNLRS